MKGSRFIESASIVTPYEQFALETSPTSPVWARLCRWIADTP